MAKRVINKPQRQPVRRAEPYYDLRTKSTKWGTDVRIGELPRKAKRG